MFASHRGTPYSSLSSVAGMPGLPHNAMLDLEFAEFSDRGRVREHNEDFLGHWLPASPTEVRRNGWLFALADGVGGQECGEVASRMAVEALVAGFPGSAGEPLSTLLPRLVRDANLRVYEAGLAGRASGNMMATTLVACALRNDRAAVAHVGDSRCYLLRNGSAVQLTQDHTVANDHIRLGLLSADDAADAETRHLLTRSLGGNLFVNPEVKEHQLLPGDVLVLCCDGLHGPLTAGDIALAGSRADLEGAARDLVTLANQRDGSDNISVQLVRVRSVERVGMYRGRPYKLR